MKLTGYIICPKIYLLLYVTWDDDVTSRDNDIIMSKQPPSWIRHLGFRIFSKLGPAVTIDGDQTQFVAFGNDLQLTCQYVASPPASDVLWKKHGTVIARNASVEINDPRVTIPHYNESHVQLKVSTTTSQDAGNYICLVTNDLGNSSDTTIIVIEVKPLIATHPQGDTVREGGNFNMYCNATGTPELTISWTRNESPINTSDNSRISLLDDNKQLTITNVSRTDSGEYRCVAKNRVGRDTSNATTVNVLYKPDITAHPNHRTATEGKNVALSCNADGNPAPTISWTINGSRVNTSGNSRISLSEDKKELFITNVSRTDSGEYRCVANNSVGNDTSNAAELHIQYQSKITAHPQNTTATEGKNVTLSCNADGNPEPTISWTRDGAPVDTSNTSRISFSDDKKQLTITNVNRTDSGDYRCVANNSLGNDTSYVATLDIQFAPEILKNPNDVTAVEGQDAVFSCSVRGNPSPSVSWTKDDEKLNVTANPRLSVSKTNNNHSLIITDVQRSDAGQYRCVAINIINSSTSTAATLQVHFQPYFTWNPEDTTVVEGQNTTLNCEVYGNPVPDVRWTKYGEALDIANQRLNVPFTANTSILTITNVVQADQGLYRCVANNSVNTSTSNPGKLTVHFAPEVTIIGDPEQFVITGKQMLLTCQYNALPPMSEVLWKKNGTVLARNAIVEINDSRVTIPHYNESHVQLSINTTTPQDAGNYSCNVTNDVDSSSDMITIVIQGTYIYLAGVSIDLTTSSYYI
ncbi:hypothetical protein ACROYT_G043850 [Oculina patagonica]